MKRTPLQRKTPLRRRSTLATKSRKPTAYTKDLREYIRERDQHICQICGRSGTQIHHVVPRGRFVAAWYTFENVHDPRNLMLVCHRCHRRIHDEPGMVEEVIHMQEQRFGPLRKTFG
ncbi:HNH endonuclease [Alicyclobacillus macrosporangiidus]|uniref:HNH endonuclease n=1 Tax=Alicyclobacillus macrosporangiidus TaxID=392015 RepID=A0A1I7IAT4_9BACL|nr:HNH endonuclease [Alicyclobacillus macrosporangiidus]